MDDYEDERVRKLRDWEKKAPVGEVRELRIEMTEEEFLDAWAKECAEWQAIKDAKLETFPDFLSAAMVTDEQRARQLLRGEKPLDMGRIWITGHGWMIPR